MNKKGAELAMNLIVIAVIALLVMVVVLFIFGGKANIFSKGTDACSSKQGVCIPKEETCSGPVIEAKDCLEFDPPQRCCLKVG